MGSKKELSIYRKNLAFNFSVVPARNDRSGGMMVSALPKDEKERLVPSKQVYFFLNINDIGALLAACTAREPYEKKLYHKPDGDQASPALKSFVLNRKSPIALQVSLTSRGFNNPSESGHGDNNPAGPLGRNGNFSTTMGLEEILVLEEVARIATRAALDQVYGDKDDA